MNKNNKKYVAPKGSRGRNELVVAMLMNTKGGPMKDRRAERGGSKKAIRLQDND